MFRMFVVVLMSGVLVVSCRAKQVDDALSPPETPLFLKEGVGYGVINASFVNVLREPHASAASAGLIRRGSVVVVVERRTVLTGIESNGPARLWAFVETRAEDEGEETRPVAGWLPGDSLDFYASLPQAETASVLMK
jgi:hypothetical protein